MQRIATLLFRSDRFKALASSCSLAALVLFASGCSGALGGRRGNAAWLESGALALSRPVPPAMTAMKRPDNAPQTAPPTASLEVTQLVVSRSDRTIALIQPGSSPLVFKTEGAQSLPGGSFSITLKEADPLWYAPNEYFTNRSLQVPAQGSRARFMRAALGHRALYLNDQTPIHSGPVWLKEIGGLRLKQQEMEQLYSMVNVGTRVEVR